MTSKDHIKYLKSLSKKKYRLANQQFLVDGYRAVKELIQSNQQLEKLYTTTNFISDHPNLEKKLRSIDFEILNESDFSQILETKTPQHIMALVATKKQFNENPLNGNILILDNISDPGNMGTLLRTAAWYGITNVFCSINCVDIYNPKVVRSAMGAHFHIENLHTIKLSNLIGNLKTIEAYTVISATLDGTPYKKFNNQKKNWALILGSEAHGIRKEIIDISDQRISIPRIGPIESLNVAVAGSIILDRLTTN